MNELAGIAIDELLSALRRRRIPMPYDSGTFVALEVCESLQKHRVHISPQNVTINADGMVAVTAESVALEEQVVRETLELLASMLVAAGPGVPQTLLALIERGLSEGPWTLSRLRNDLDACLVPLNRSAARRVLARLVRDAGKDGGPRPSSRPPAPARAIDDLDADLDALLSDAPVAASPVLKGAPVTVHDQSTAPLIASPPLAPQAPPMARVHAAESAAQSSVLEPVPEEQHRQAIAVRDADAQRRRAEQEARFGELSVGSAPAQAQVFMFVGRGPAVIADLPVGVAHEFLALADGKAPARAVLASDAEWESEGGSVRYELAVQTGDADVSFDNLDVGVSRLPQDVGTARGQMGSVRVVTTPRGAKVYQLVGFTPQVHLTGVPTDAALELLVAAPGHHVERVVVGPSDWRAENGHRTASVDVTLRPR
ncbi:MAG: hypothetical protein IPK60_25320 [Sandaracinaceae bacterium]|nr:hypothetical protein [Sandaracinaceae bacterium]